MPIKRFMHKIRSKNYNRIRKRTSKNNRTKNGNTRSTRRIQKRSHTVEPPFEVLKQQKQLNTVHVTGQEEVKNRITLKAIGYNLKRLENMIKNNVEESNSLKNFANILHRENPNIKFSFIIQ